jgi:hypothetical protein
MKQTLPLKKQALITGALLFFVLFGVQPILAANGHKAAAHARRRAVATRPRARRVVRRVVRRAHVAPPRAVASEAEVYRQQLVDAINEEAQRHRIDPLLIWALISQESGGKRHALSPKGAYGPFQLMPGTAARWGVRDRSDPRQAARGAVAYLVWLIDRFGGDVRLGLAGYNAGEGAVEKYGRRIPPYRETQNYVRIIEARYLAMRKAYGSRYNPSSQLTQTALVRPGGSSAPAAPAPTTTAEVKPQSAPAPITDGYVYRIRINSNSNGYAVARPNGSEGTQEK